jgi:hypothetical protein
MASVVGLKMNEHTEKVKLKQFKQGIRFNSISIREVQNGKQQSR